MDLDLRQAKRAVLRGSIRLPQHRKIHVLEVYCDACRRPWDDVCDEPCSASESTEHLRGGPIRERKKRRHNHRCDLLGCDVASQHGDAEPDADAPAVVSSLTG